MKRIFLLTVCLIMISSAAACSASYTYAGADKNAKPLGIVSASPSPAAVQSAAPSPDSSPSISSAQIPKTITPGSPDVPLLHNRLLELGYYLSDEPSDIYGDKTAVAVSEFQRVNGLTQTGKADAKTCAALFSSGAVKCPDFSDLAPTVNMSFAELAGDDGLRSMPDGYPAQDTYRIIVDIEHQVTLVYAKDADGNYTVPVRYMLCSTGLKNRTPIGTFKMGAYRVRFAQFRRDKRYGQYWTQIRGAIYFHTFLYSKKDASTYDERTYEELGQKASHGCIRLTVPDARFMWYNIAYGTTCEIRKGDANDTATAMIREQLLLTKLPAGRLALTAGDIPNTDNWAIEDVKKELPYKKGSQS